MKKYMSLLLILTVAAAFSISFVVATDFEQMEFDGKFKMDVFKDSNFDRYDMDGVITFLDIDKESMVIYMENELITPDIDESYFESFTSSSGFEEDGTDGDIRVYKGDGMYGAMAIGDGIVVVVGCQDRTDAIDMAKSIEFAK